MIFNADGVTVAVFGDIIFDIFCTVLFRKQSAEDETAKCFDMVGQEIRLPGGSGCTARCVEQLGGIPEVYAVIGTGSTARRLRDALRARNIFQTRIVQVEGRRTTEITRFIDQKTNRILSVVERSDRAPIPDHAREALAGYLHATKAKVILVSDYERGVLTPEIAQEISTVAREKEIKLIVDARRRPLKWYKDNFSYLYLITPNTEEAEAMVGRALRTVDDIKDAGREIRDALRCHVLLKRSSRGARLFLAHNSRHSSADGTMEVIEEPGSEYAYEAYNKNVVCVSGAGDTLAATIALAVANGMLLSEACEIGSRAAAITVGKPGSEVARLYELNAVLEQIERERPDSVRTELSPLPSAADMAGSNGSVPGEAAKPIEVGVNSEE